MPSADRQPTSRAAAGAQHAGSTRDGTAGARALMPPADDFCMMIRRRHFRAMADISPPLYACHAAAASEYRPPRLAHEAVPLGFPTFHAITGRLPSILIKIDSRLPRRREKLPAQPSEAQYFSLSPSIALITFLGASLRFCFPREPIALEIMTQIWRGRKLSG